MNPVRDGSPSRSRATTSRPLLVVVIVGGLVRTFAQVAYWPSPLQWGDAPRYARIGYWEGAFNDYWAPAGYAAFLAVLRLLSTQLGVAIIAQHALGLATAVLLAMDEPTRARLERTMSLAYPQTQVRRLDRGVELLAAYQDATRRPGGFLFAFVGAAIAALIRTEGTRRREIALAVLAGMTLLVVPILLVTWDFRYTLPAAPVFALAAVLGTAPVRSRSANAPGGGLAPANEAP